MAEYSVVCPENKADGYGIKAVSTKYYYDISHNRAALTEFCEMCNELDLELVHFDTVLEDYLSRKAFL